MSAGALENTLRDLQRIGTLVKDRGYRQIWRFDHEGRGYYLKFYRRAGFRDRFRRTFRGSPAMAEFSKLQRLGMLKIPAPRPVAALMGFSIGPQVGDAVILEEIPNAVPLDEYANGYLLQGLDVPDHLQLATKIRSIVSQLARARLGHEDLHLGNFLLQGDRLFLLDGYAVRFEGMTLADLLHLGHSVSRFATRTDLLRGWFELGPNRPPPRFNPEAEKQWSNFLQRKTPGNNRYFGRISHDRWSGSFFKSDKHPRRWSGASQLQITREQWEQALPTLLGQVERDELQVIKRGRSGDVLGAELELGGQRVAVVIKRPRHRDWFQTLKSFHRGTRARREWFKAWKMIVRAVPTAWPLLYVEKRQFGYLTDGLVIFERVPGPMLAWAKLEEFSPADRRRLFYRAGRLLRRIDRLGFAHFDAKAANWIIRPDAVLGPTPVLIDIDGIRHRRWTALGIHRLLRSMQENPQYTADDSLALCLGYAPTATPVREEDPARSEAAIDDAR